MTPKQAYNLLFAYDECQKPARQWTPFEMKIVLHHYGSIAEFGGCAAPIYPETISRLKELGVLEDRIATHDEDKNPYQTTVLGNALVEMWCQQPLPVVTYVDPRFAEGQPR
ncbi:hypothetical protein J1C56_01960 [Aminobacter anthyllidis]|uniref:Uncharacterized protein n=1 Tax=Aminobacter anthyllidis TaxID=1035067 RepID=A0A9X1A6R9_9HYPH|nr:hypothetical protein [Aminobacter anthyllidis]MBT1154349.1 hypothetical protein [Aminobacter anthyllidis]